MRKLGMLLLLVVVAGAISGCSQGNNVTTSDVDKWQNEGLPEGEKAEKASPNTDQPNQDTSDR